MRVLYFPEDEMRLRRRATELPADAFGTPQIRELGELLAEAIGYFENVDVLATTQLDFDPAWRMLVLRTPRGNSILCNPRIRSHADESLELSACASFACVPERLSFPRKLTVEFRRLDGKREEVECGASGARAVWQGIESLDGKIFLDRIHTFAKGPFLRKVRIQRTRGRA